MNRGEKKWTRRGNVVENPSKTRRIQRRSLGKLVIGRWLTVTSSPSPAADNYIPVGERRMRSQRFAKIDRSIDRSRQLAVRRYGFIYGSINKTDPRRFGTDFSSRIVVPRR